MALANFSQCKWKRSVTFRSCNTTCTISHSALLGSSIGPEIRQWNAIVSYCILQFPSIHLLRAMEIADVFSLSYSTSEEFWYKYKSSMCLRTLGSNTFLLQVTTFSPAYEGVKRSFHFKAVYWLTWKKFGGLDPVPSSTSQKPLLQFVCINWLSLFKSLSREAKSWMGHGELILLSPSEVILLFQAWGPLAWLWKETFTATVTVLQSGYICNSISREDLSLLFCQIDLLHQHHTI